MFITRVEHEYIFDPARLSGEGIVLHEGTSIEERIRNRYPNLTILTTKTEAEALSMILNRQADMPLRSLTMAAYTIRDEKLFNLKIAGQLQEFENNFRMWRHRDHESLRAIMNLNQ